MVSGPASRISADVGDDAPYWISNSLFTPPVMGDASDEVKICATAAGLVGSAMPTHDAHE